MVCEKVRFLYRGRPDGLGNRLEEVIRLVAVQARLTSPSICYLWNLSPRPDRNYWPRFSSPLKIVPLPFPLPANGWSQLTADLPTTDELRAAAAQVTLHRVVAPIDTIIHLRAGDRIRPDATHPHFMDLKMQRDIASRALVHAAGGRKVVGVISDNAEVANKCCRRLRELGTDAVVIAGGDVWGALAALQTARVIVMASRFSSLSLVGALIGAREIHVPRETQDSDLQRFGLEATAVF